jgi:hypothetical protein
MCSRGRGQARRLGSGLRREIDGFDFQPARKSNPGTDMGRQTVVVLYVVAMVAVIVGADLAFFRNRFWERLAVNVGIVLVFAAFYWRFLARP